MELVIAKNRRKIKLVGVRLYKEEYEFITRIAKKKKVSRSFVAESLLRAAMHELKSEGQKAKWRYEAPLIATARILREE